MTPARILLDEMITPVVAAGLRRHGHDATAVTDLPGVAGSFDERILELAAAERRILVTLNIADFRILDATWKSTGRSHHGIACVSTKALRQNRNFPGALTAALHHAAATGSLPGPDEVAFLHLCPDHVTTLDLIAGVAAPQTVSRCNPRDRQRVDAQRRSDTRQRRELGRRRRSADAAIGSAHLYAQQTGRHRLLVRPEVARRLMPGPGALPSASCESLPAREPRQP